MLPVAMALSSLVFNQIIYPIVTYSFNLNRLLLLLHFSFFERSYSKELIPLNFNIYNVVLP